LLSLPTITAVEVSGPRVVHPAEQLVAAAAEAGLPGVGLDWFSLRDAERRGVGVEMLAETAAALSLTWTDLSALGLGADATRDQRVAGVMARHCTVLGIGVCGLVISVPVDKAVVDRVARCAEVFSAAGVRLALEFVPYSEIRRLDEARELCDRIGREVCGVLVDTLHLVRSGGSVADVADLDATELAAVQIADCAGAVPPDLPTESREARLLPGEGTVDFPGLVAAFERIGWSGVVSTEVLSARLRRLPPAELAEACAVSARQFFAHRS
jgi:sugar phosphate isomerase/epimerase